MVRLTEQWPVPAQNATSELVEAVPHLSRTTVVEEVPIPHVSGLDRGVLDPESFHRALSIERKRTERSRKPFLLMLLDVSDCLGSAEAEEVLDKIFSVLCLSTREIDATGWYQPGVLGVMFTEIAADSQGASLDTVMTRVTETLRSNLNSLHFSRIPVSFHVYPEEWDATLPLENCDRTLYPDLSRRDEDKRSFRLIKRLMDILGSALALAFLAPLFLFVAAAIKLTSKGPVFFRQTRVGQYGKLFVLLKFRSMRVNNDAAVHQDYVKKLIAGQADRKKSNGNGQGIYKLTDDPRITRIGALLRRTSLDEVPQFINVLKGEMSLVGPRPAIDYEVEAYDIWHRRRILECKPGITGLWQVNGRSRVTFNDMVRLDLHYAKHWSPWMDIKILLRTPAAVVMGEGAC